MCFSGILLHTFSLNWPKWSSSPAYAFLETCIYVSMGWLVVVAFEHLAESFTLSANIELFKGKHVIGRFYFRRYVVYDWPRIFCMGLS